MDLDLKIECLALLCVIKMLFNKCVLVLNLEKVSGDRSGKNALFDNVRSRALFPAVVTS